MRLSRQDYEPLKGFFGWMFDHVLSISSSVPEEAHPMNVLAQFESRSHAIARQGLGMAIGDVIESTQDLRSEQVAQIDEALRAQGLPTLSEVKARFSSVIAGIVRRGTIRNEREYYAVRNAVEALPEAAQTALWRLLADFEERIGSAARQSSEP